MTSSLIGRGSLAVGLVLTMAATAHAQSRDTTRTDTTRATSTQRIPVQKGQPTTTRRTSTGDVRLTRDSAMIRDSLARRDSLMRDSLARRDSVVRDSIARRDSIVRDSVARDSLTRRDTTMRTDTTVRRDTTMTPPDTVTRTDTIVQRTDEPEQFGTGRAFGRGMYVGVAGGANVPIGDFESSGFSTGWGIEVPIGWQSATGPFGLRLNLGYSRLRGETVRFGSQSITNPDPKLLSANLDATLRFPLGGSVDVSRVGFYLAGGGGVYHFRDINEGVLSGELRNDPNQPGTIDTDEESVTKWGLNAGAGFDVRIGNAAFFVESRLANVFSSGDSDLRFVPIVLGFKFF